MPESGDLFATVRATLDRLANTPTEALRLQVYGRHDALGRFSWDDEPSLLAAIADPYGTPLRLVPPLDYAKMNDAEIRQQCRLIVMLTAQPPSTTPAMPKMRAGADRSYAQAADIQAIIDWLKSLPFPRS